MPSEPWAAGTLRELRRDLPDLDRALAEALRAAFKVMGISLRAYATQHHLDVAVVSRFLSAKRIPPKSFVDRAIELAGSRLTPQEATTLRNLHNQRVKETADRQECRVRTLTARIHHQTEQAETAGRRHQETVIALRRAQSEIRRLRTQLQVSRGPLDDPSDAVLSELERYATLRTAGASDAATCVSPDTHRRWRTVLNQYDRAPALTWTDTAPCTLERRLASYQRLDLDQLHRDALDALVPLRGAGYAPPSEVVAEVHSLALRAMHVSGPLPLTRALDYWSESRQSTPGTNEMDTSQFAFRGHLGSGELAGPLIVWPRRANNVVEMARPFPNAIMALHDSGDMMSEVQGASSHHRVGSRRAACLDGHETARGGLAVNIIEC